MRTDVGCCPSGSPASVSVSVTSVVAAAPGVATFAVMRHHQHHQHHHHRHSASLPSPSSSAARPPPCGGFSDRHAAHDADDDEEGAVALDPGRGVVSPAAGVVVGRPPAARPAVAPPRAAAARRAVAEELGARLARPGAVRRRQPSIAAAAHLHAVELAARLAARLGRDIVAAAGPDRLGAVVGRQERRALRRAGRAHARRARQPCFVAARLPVRQLLVARAVGRVAAARLLRVAQADALAADLARAREPALRRAAPLRRRVAHGVLREPARRRVAARVVPAPLGPAAVAVLPRVYHPVAAHRLGHGRHVLVASHARRVDVAPAPRRADLPDRARRELRHPRAHRRVHHVLPARVAAAAAQRTAQALAAAAAALTPRHAVVHRAKVVAQLVRQHLPLGRRPYHHVGARRRAHLAPEQRPRLAHAADPRDAHRRARVARRHQRPRRRPVVEARLPPRELVEPVADGQARPAGPVPRHAAADGALGVRDGNVAHPQLHVEGALVDARRRADLRQDVAPNVPLRAELRRVRAVGCDAQQRNRPRGRAPARRAETLQQAGCRIAAAAALASLQHALLHAAVFEPVEPTCRLGIVIASGERLDIVVQVAPDDAVRPVGSRQRCVSVVVARAAIRRICLDVVLEAVHKVRPFEQRHAVIGHVQRDARPVPPAAILFLSVRRRRAVVRDVVVARRRRLRAADRAVCADAVHRHGLRVQVLVATQREAHPLRAVAAAG
ncbi:hypothetical protein IF1G_07242 [Cordyceps javanica]|uniref:Uncharacterized protein n=1 Tax=Cordyceps javanica TaxID=43265 RepID=A0A545UY32_9HYPO|nr:hypothetical protein IF1G_07242 [Cordyceps javanica]